MFLVDSYYILGMAFPYGWHKGSLSYHWIITEHELAFFRGMRLRLLRFHTKLSIPLPAPLNWNVDEGNCQYPFVLSDFQSWNWEKEC